MKRVILGCDTNLDYAFSLPIACLAWRKRGWLPTIIFAGDVADWMREPRLYLVASRCRELGAEATWVGRFSEVSRTSTVAQCSRLLGHLVPGIESGDDLITSDADMIPVGPWVGGRALEPGTFQSYYANAYAGEGIPHWPICYLRAEASTWAEVMGGGTLREALADLLSLAPSDSTGAWNFDEHEFGRRLVAWGGYATRARFVDRRFVEGEWRIDRCGWNDAMGEVSRRGSLQGVADAHIIRPGWTDENWPRLRWLLTLLFSSDQMAWVDEYREAWGS